VKPHLDPWLLLAQGISVRCDAEAQTAAGRIVSCLAWLDLAEGADNFMCKQDYVCSRSHNAWNKKRCYSLTVDAREEIKTL
jgi:hypothetical protein